MKINIGVIAILFLFLINILIGGVFLSTMNSITVPEIISYIDIIGINKDQMVMDIKIEIDNKNDFSLSIDKFNVKSIMSSGDPIGTITIPGGEISSNSKKTFQSQATYSLDNYDLRQIHSTINSLITIGFFGFFEKEIPITLHIIASFEKIIDNIDLPIIHINAGLTEITERGVIFSGFIEITNTNDFEIIMENMSSMIQSDSGEILGSIQIPNTYIKQKETTKVLLDAEIIYEALDAKSIFIDFTGDIGLMIAGLNRTMTVSTQAEIEIPDINEILLINDIFEFSISAEFKVRIQGIITTVGLKIYNPSNISFEAKNLVCQLYTETDNETKLIVGGTMNPCEISTNQEVCIKTTVTMPYLKLLSAIGPKLFPEWFALKITGDFSIMNTTQSIPISINGLIDPQILT
jgi:hypothetical protein